MSQVEQSQCASSSSGPVTRRVLLAVHTGRVDIIELARGRPVADDVGDAALDRAVAEGPS